VKRRLKQLRLEKSVRSAGQSFHVCVALVKHLHVCLVKTIGLYKQAHARLLFNWFIVPQLRRVTLLQVRSAVRSKLVRIVVAGHLHAKCSSPNQPASIIYPL